MPKQRQNHPHYHDQHQEQIEISFLGFRFKCSGPTFKTVIILVIILTFLLVLAHWLPKFPTVKWLTG